MLGNVTDEQTCPYKMFKTLYELWIKPRFILIQRFHTTMQFLLSSFDYEDAGYEPAELIKIDFLLNGKPVEELTTIVHK